MSKPSAKHSTRKKVKKSLLKVTPEADAFRKAIFPVLLELRTWGQSLEAMTRQKYTPEAMQEVLTGYVNMLLSMTTLTRAASKIRVPIEEDKDLQACLANAANILAFFQGPILDGVFNEKDPSVVLNEFIDIVNAQVQGPEAGEKENPE